MKKLNENRPPIVVILGHVDHGKTTLLDKLAKTKLAAREAGGITQSVGAYLIKTEDRKLINFIDTPGHAAFSSMRSHGATIADIALLVVAVDDGVKPQTKEAIEYIIASKTSYIVVFTKADLPSADLEKAKGELAKAGVLLEGRGGDVVSVVTSAKTGKGLDELLEMINLVSEIDEIGGSPDQDLDVFVLETTKDRKGLTATVVVKNGSLKVGDMVESGGMPTKIRGIFDQSGKSAKEILPGYVGQVLGFKKLPDVGSNIKAVSGEGLNKTQVVAETTRRSDIEGIPVILKANSSGELEALLSQVPEGIGVLHSGVGDITESDVFLAKSQDAYLFAFRSKFSNSIKKLADMEGITVKSFKIIYELFDELEEIVKAGQEVVLGEAEIITSFPFNKKLVAGCKMKSGKISKSDTLELRRGDKLIGTAKAATLRKVKLEVNEVKAGEEFGVLLEPQLAFEPKDMLISVKK